MIIRLTIIWYNMAIKMVVVLLSLARTGCHLQELPKLPADAPLVKVIHAVAPSPLATVDATVWNRWPPGVRMTCSLAIWWPYDEDKTWNWGHITMTPTTAILWDMITRGPMANIRVNQHSDGSHRPWSSMMYLWKWWLPIASCNKLHQINRSS